MVNSLVAAIIPNANTLNPCKNPVTPAWNAQNAIKAKSLNVNPEKVEFSFPAHAIQIVNTPSGTNPLHKSAKNALGLF
jgi:hypothetical protein